MKTSRGLAIWGTLALCGLTVLGAMTWLTRGVLASERQRSQAESRADLEERTRLALWRMDALGAAIIAGENRHPPAAYQSPDVFADATQDPAIKLHFELYQNERLASPEIRKSTAQLEDLRRLLSRNPLPGDEWSLLICAAEAGENAWNLVPKDATRKMASNLSLRGKSGAKIREDPIYQTNSNDAELTKRAATLSNSIETSQTMMQLDPPSQTSTPGGQILDLGAMRSAWVGDELFLLRQLKKESSGVETRGVQGVWLDHDILKNRLLGEIADLLPASSLVASKDSSADSMALVSFPFRLVRNESAPATSSPMIGPLAVGWVTVLLAILTSALLVHGVMRLSERRASFVSAVTHELRTPLTTFRLYSDMMESGVVKPEKQGDYLRVLSREADRLSHLVENVLSFSRIERGSARSAVCDLSLHSLLEPMRERLEARLATAGMTLEMDTTCARMVRVDRAAVEHILFNLVDNSAKYAAAGDPPRVEILTSPADRHLEIHVRDHGPGIPVVERRRIFRAFHKSAFEAAESQPGVGLGLALSRRLAKSLGGGLECVDSPQGACFVLRLPLA